MEPTEALKLNQQVFVLGKDDMIFSVPILKIITIEEEAGTTVKYFLADDMADERTENEIYITEDAIKAALKEEIKKRYKEELAMVDSTEVKTYGK